MDWARSEAVAWRVLWTCSGPNWQPTWVWPALQTSRRLTRATCEPGLDKRKTLSKQPSASIQHKQLAAAQGSSLSPLTKKGSISLYSRIFTVASLGALPCAITRNARSDCATIARARSFLWIEWYLDGTVQCSSGMT